MVEVEVEAAGGLDERGCGCRWAGRAGDACPTRQLHGRIALTLTNPYVLSNVPLVRAGMTVSQLSDGASC